MLSRRRAGLIGATVMIVRKERVKGQGTESVEEDRKESLESLRFVLDLLVHRRHFSSRYAEALRLKSKRSL